MKKPDTNDNPAETEQIFVYGTLRRGGSNAHRLANARFVSPANVRGWLYEISWYPGAVLDPSGGIIHGELWEIPPEILPDLDAFEGDEYRRIRADVTLPSASPPTASAWIWEWTKPTDPLPRILSGDWLAADGRDALSD